jgi:hypothetical protein
VDVTLSCTDPVGAELGYGISYPAHGDLEVGDGLTVTYTPEPGFSGTDTFTYHAESELGGTGGAAPITITVSAPAGGATAPPPPRPAVHSPVVVRIPRPTATTPPRPVVPVLPFGGLTVEAKQKGRAVKGTLKVASAGSRLDVALTIPGRTRKAKRITIGTLTARDVKAGPHDFTVKLDKKHGLAAQRRHRTLKVTVRVRVTPPTGAPRTVNKAITLTR